MYFPEYIKLPLDRENYNCLPMYLSIGTFRSVPQLFFGLPRGLSVDSGHGSSECEGLRRPRKVAGHATRLPGGARRRYGPQASKSSPSRANSAAFKPAQHLGSSAATASRP